MTANSRSTRSAIGDHSAHFEQLISGGGQDSNPLMPEYRLLYRC